MNGKKFKVAVIGGAIVLVPLTVPFENCGEAGNPETEIRNCAVRPEDLHNHQEERTESGIVIRDIAASAGATGRAF